MIRQEFPLRALMLLACWLLEACAMVSAPISRGEMLAEQQARLERIAWPLLVAGAELCGSAATITYGIELEDDSPGIRVKNSHPKLPGGLAGVRKGDRVVSLEHQDMTRSQAVEALSIVRRLNRLHIALLEMRLERNGLIRDIAIDGVPACNYGLVLASSDSVNALADGKRLLLTSGMMRFVRNDAELALVIGHEIAHNALQHGDTLRLRSLLDRLVSAHTGFREPGDPSLERNLEIEADYVGLYIIVRAGYDLALIGDFWRRLEDSERFTGAEQSQFSKSHPTTRARSVAFEETVREIRKKRASEAPLLPDLTDSSR